MLMPCCVLHSVGVERRTAMTLQIREPQPADLPSLVALWNAAHPQRPTSEAKLARRLTMPAARLQPGGMVAEEDGRVIGVGTYRWSQHLPTQPVKFWVDRLVSAPERSAVQSRICAALEQQAAALGQSDVYAVVREDDATHVAIYQRRGYREEMRSFGARLAVQQFDASPYAGHQNRLRESGIEITTLGALERAAADRAALYERLFNVYIETALDSPDVGGSGAPTLDAYVGQNLTGARTIPDAYFVAMHGEEPVGLSELFATTSPGRFNTGSTVVRRAYRRRGIGLGLKLRAIAYAQAHNGEVIATGFAAQNQASVRLNLKLGFVCEPAWITFYKSLPGG